MLSNGGHVPFRVTSPKLQAGLYLEMALLQVLQTFQKAFPDENNDEETFTVDAAIQTFHCGRLEKW